MPPSSLRGIVRALDRGAAGVEIDLQLSRDSIPMLYHDEMLPNSTNGIGCVSEHTAAELVRLKYHGGWPYDWLQNEQPVTFDTLLAVLARRAGPFPKIDLDLHEEDACAPDGQALARMPNLVRQTVQSLKRYHVPPEQVLITSMVPATLRAFRAAWPALPLGLEVTKNFAAGLQMAQLEKVKSIVLDGDQVTPEQSAQAHAVGLEVVVFGGRSGGDIKRVLATNPDVVEVDNVQRLRAILRK